MKGNLVKVDLAVTDGKNYSLFLVEGESFRSSLSA